MRGVTLETGVILVVLLLIVAVLFYYLYTNFVSSQRTLTGQQCDILLKTACDTYMKQVQKNPKEAFRGVPEGCVEKGLLRACINGDAEACEFICEFGWVGEVEPVFGVGFGEIVYVE
jgi:hypothetical protein